MYQGFYLSYRSLGATYEWGYEHLRLASFTIELDRAPRETVKRLRAIPGVREVAGRIKQDVRIEQSPGRRKVVTGRVISVPNDGEVPINQLIVLEGSYLGPPDRREVLLERGFAEAHDYRPGDVIYPVVGDVRSAFRVVGIVSSIEYLYVVRSREHLFPTPDSFGVMWMRRQQAERLFQMHGMIDEVVCVSLPGERDRVMEAMYADLRRFGARSPVPDEQQPSRDLLDQDLEVWAQFAVIFPGMFIGAAALTVFSILARTVQQEQRQIGFLRASGLPAWRVGLQYLSFAGLMGVVGVAPGIVLGQWFAIGITWIYLEEMGITFLQMASGIFVALIGFAIALVSSLLAGWGPSQHLARMSPADAMRPGAGSSARLKPPRILTRLQRGAPFTTRMAISNLFRQKYRTAYTIVGVAIGIIMMLTTMSIMDAMNYAIDYYFTSVRDYDVDVGFAAPVSEGIVRQVRQWPEVEWAEGGVGLPVTLHIGDRSYDYTISGVPPDSRLQIFRDEQERPVQLHGDGLYPATPIARQMGVERGDLLRLEYAHNSREVHIEQPVRVAQAVRQPVGAGVYMTSDALRQRFGDRLGFPPGTVGGMSIKARPGYEEVVAARASDLPGVVAVDTTYDTRRYIEMQMRMSYIFLGVLVLFAGALTVAIVYNTINSNIRERRSEIASLRALGLRMNEITRVLTIENLCSALLGVLVGVPLGMAASRGLLALWESEVFSLDFYIAPHTYIIAVGFTLLLVIACQIPALRETGRMNLARMTRLHGE